MQYKIIDEYNLKKNSILLRIGNDMLDIFYKFFSDRFKYNLNTFLMSVLARNKELKGIKFEKYSNKKTIICISHDIDYSHTINLLWGLLKLEKKYGIKSTVNVLTNDDYKLSRNFFKKISKYANIGLHGYTHDANLSYRNKKKILKQLFKAKYYLDKLNVHAIGYRAPCISMTNDLFSVLPKIGIKYDSSIPLISLFYGTTKIPIPTYIKKFDIWEFPLLIQDEHIFREKKMNNREAMEFIKKYFKKINDCKGLFICNFHPSVTGPRLGFYESFLRYIKGSGAEIITMEELYNRCKKYAAK